MRWGNYGVRWPPPPHTHQENLEYLVAPLKAFDSLNSFKYEFYEFKAIYFIKMVPTFLISI